MLTAADKARLHFHTLQGAGWSLRAIAGHGGISATDLSRFITKGADLPHVAAGILRVDPNTLPERSNHDGEPFVSRTGTVRRLQALLYMGWGHQQMREQCGLRTHLVLHQQGRWVTRSTHDKVAAMYRDLALKEGPSSKARTWARKLGYVGPMGWDDIDHDPEPEAIEADGDDIDEAVVERLLAGDTRVAESATPAERAEVARRWVRAGGSLSDLARRTGWKVERYYTVDGAA